MALVTIFDFLTFFLGLALTALGEFFILAGGADSNFGLAVFSILIILVGLGISYVREVTSDNVSVERDIRRIYGLVCFISGVAFVLIPIVRAAALLIGPPPGMSLGSAILLSFTVLVGIVLLFLGYSWVGAFDQLPEEPEEYTETRDQYDYR
ncbi:MAG: hypothetical protein WCS37_15390 [Chloroflexota bacterium]